MHNYKYKKDNLDEITEEHMLEVAIAAMGGPITSVAPLGFSGDNFYLYGEFIEATKEERWRRKSIVSFRRYGRTLELFISDKEGNTIIYNKLDGLGAEQVVREYYRQFLVVKHLIDSEIERSFEEGFFEKTIGELIEESVGFKLLEKLAEVEKNDK